MSVSEDCGGADCGADDMSGGDVPQIKLSDGRSIPAIGLGTWKSNPGEVGQAVKDAIDIGYRHLDCAFLYRNQPEIGKAIRQKIKEGVVSRDELYITTKLWSTQHEPELVEPSCRKCLEDLGLDYLDLYLIHFPVAYKAGDEMIPGLKDGKVEHIDVDYVDTWKAMERLVELGLVRSIGVSNFNSRQLERVLEVASIPPVTNQIECHPYLTQTKLTQFCKLREVTITAYSPLGSPDSPLLKSDDPKLLEDPQIQEIADRLGKTPAQVLIRYQIDRGHIVIPKSVSKTRLAQNFDIFNFRLSHKDVKLINGFNRNIRFLPLIWSSEDKYYPFNED